MHKGAGLTMVFVNGNSISWPAKSEKAVFDVIANLDEQIRTGNKWLIIPAIASLFQVSQVAGFYCCVYPVDTVPPTTEGTLE